jgi:hypothetical protein
MKSQKHFAGWLTAALIGAAAVAMAPHLFGGGGDEGVDILPFAGGSGGGTTPPKPQLGYITLEKTAGLSYDKNAVWQNSGVLFSPHRLTDVFVGHMGQEPFPGMTSIDVVAKGTQHLSFGSIGNLVHLDGRYEMTDVDPLDRETLTLVGHWYMPAVQAVIIGVRGTHIGPIPASFTQIDSITASPLQTGMVDLKLFRQQSVLALGGSRRDVAIGILLPGPFDSVIASWAAFNVDDTAAVYDVQNNGN